MANQYILENDSRQLRECELILSREGNLVLCIDGWEVCSIDPEGYMKRIKDIQPGQGLEVDENGRIRLKEDDE